MVNNFTNINKTKERLESDGQQFYQYQQNKTINDAITILIVIWDKCKIYSGGEVLEIHLNQLLFCVNKIDLLLKILSKKCMI